MATADLFDPNKPPPSRLGRATFRAIADRLKLLHPPIDIGTHIAARTLVARDSTLDGIEFKAADPRRLAAVFDSANDSSGKPALTSMKEDPDHWALKASFGATVGTGWREIWRPQKHDWANHLPGPDDPRFRMRFGTVGTPLRFTALHCAVHEIGGGCNVHIDESGFVLETSSGVGLTPDMYDHFLNELVFKTKFREWLGGSEPNETARGIVESVIQPAIGSFFRRTTLLYENAGNGYVGLDRRLRALRPPKGPIDLLTTVGRLTMPLGASFDAYEDENIKVQITGSAFDGQRTITLTVGGEW